MEIMQSFFAILAVSIGGVVIVVIGIILINIGICIFELLESVYDIIRIRLTKNTLTVVASGNICLGDVLSNGFEVIKVEGNTLTVIRAKQEYYDDHMETLAKKYPFSLDYIRRTWEELDKCSMLRLEQTLKNIVKYCFPMGKDVKKRLGMN